MTEKTLSEKIALFSTRTTLKDIPKEVIKKAKLMILDFFAASLAGYKSPGCEEVSRLSREQGQGRCTIIGYNYKTSPTFAALANGIIGHALDYDDTHSKSILHPTVAIAPAVLSLGEDRGVSGETLLLSFIIGVETMCKLGLACKKGPLETGYIYTSLIGTFGAAAASAKILDLSYEKTLNAIGISYSFTSGNSQQLVEGTLSKRLQPGIAAMNGVLSALLADRGITGAKKVFEGKFGFYHTYLRGEYDPKPIEDLGVTYEIPQVSFKPYPCCRLTHSSIDATLKLRERYRINLVDIDEIIVRVNQQAYNANAEPLEIKRRPRNIVDAQFSIPYTVACALIYGKVGLNDFTEEAIKREEVLRVAERVTPIVDEDIEKKYGRRISPAILEVKISDGRILREEVLYPLGEPENPMSKERLLEKFLDAVKYSRIITIDDAHAIADMIFSLEKINDIREVMELLRKKIKL